MGVDQELPTPAAGSAPDGRAELVARMSEAMVKNGALVLSIRRRAEVAAMLVDLGITVDEVDLLAKHVRESASSEGMARGYLSRLLMDVEQLPAVLRSLGLYQAASAVRAAVKEQESSELAPGEAIRRENVESMLRARTSGVPEGWAAVTEPAGWRPGQMRRLGTW